MRHAWSASIALLKRHWIFSIVFAIGAVLRIIVSVAYRPALFFYGDSYSYLTNARHLRPDPIHPILYPLFLRPFLAIHHLLPVPIVQHIMGLACGLLVYLLLRRLGLGPGWAVAGAAPVLLDAYQLNVEQYLLAEALFEVLILGAFVAMLWWKRPSAAACGVAGGLLGLAALARTIGLANAELSLSLPSPRPWSPDDPFLYDLQVNLKDGEKLIEVNVFSPGGIGSSSEFAGVDFAKVVIEDLQRKVEYRKYYDSQMKNVELATL